MQFKGSVPANSDNGAAMTAQFLTNDQINMIVEDTAVLNTGIVRGSVVKYSVSLSKWVLCDGTVSPDSADTSGIVEYANGTSGQVRLSGVYQDTALTTLGAYYCQSDGTIGQTETKVFIGNVTSTGKLCMPGGGGGGVQPATTEALGGVIVGTGLAVDVNGKVSFNPSFPAWFYDHGDGSDGAFNPIANCTISGVKNYTSVNIPAGVTVTVSPYVKIKCQGAAIIAGILTATGQSNTTHGYRAGSSGAGGDSYDVSGGSANVAYYISVGPVTADAIVCTSDLLTLSKYEDSIHLGSKGGSGGDSEVGSGTPGIGGNGGGCIVILADSISIIGSITANGANGSDSSDSNGYDGSGGGGGGGAVKLIAKTIINTGTVTANGGNPGRKATYGYAGAAGSAGLVFLKALGV